MRSSGARWEHPEHCRRATGRKGWFATLACRATCSSPVLEGLCGRSRKAARDQGWSGRAHSSRELRSPVQAFPGLTASKSHCKLILQQLSFLMTVSRSAHHLAHVHYTLRICRWNARTTLEPDCDTIATKNRHYSSSSVRRYITSPHCQTRSDTPTALARTRAGSPLASCSGCA